ncbi:MAG: AI-2E family transporter [Eubacteriales bacterium]
MKKKFPKNPKYTQIALYVFLTVGALMILWHLVSSSANLWTSFKEVFDFLWRSVSVIVAGVVTGYILSPAVVLFEKLLNKIFSGKKTADKKKSVDKKRANKKEKRIRLSAIAIVYIILAGIIVSIIIFIIPPLTENIIDFSDSLPGYIDTSIKWYDDNLKDSPLFTSEYTKNIMENTRVTLMERINEIAVSVVSAIANSLFSIFTGIVRVIIAFIIAFYYLLSSKDVVAGISEFGRMKLGNEQATAVGSFMKSVDNVFGKYISAKLLQILIIFLIAQTFFLILGVSLSTLMAFILAVANIIPYVGGFIGMVPPVLISLLEDPIKAIWVFGSIQIIQFIDGYVIQPFLIGDKMGLSPFWSLAVIIIGGNLFGFTGVLLSIPVAAVIGVLIRQYIKTQKKKLKEEASIK